eukprot:2320776-Pyramimonas_sp.AAC.1
MDVRSSYFSSPHHPLTSFGRVVPLSSLIVREPDQLVSSMVFSSRTFQQLAKVCWHAQLLGKLRSSLPGAVTAVQNVATNASSQVSEVGVVTTIVHYVV